MATCALCGKECVLRDSHIVPKFVVRYLKETSVGKIRNLETPNRTVEDGEKNELLCPECEELFSAREKYFADTVFYPYKRDKVLSFDYDERLFYFLTSLSWRSLYLDAQDKSYPDAALLEMKAAVDSIRQYLLGKTAALNIENHVFFFDVAESSTLADGNANRPNETVHRSITSYTVAANDNSSILVFTNMLGIVVLTFIKRGKEEYWENAEINNGTGHIEAKDQKIKSIVGDAISHMLNYAEQSTSSISPKQQEAILQRLIAHASDIQNYDVYQDWLDDRNLRN